MYTRETELLQDPRLQIEGAEDAPEFRLQESSNSTSLFSSAMHNFGWI
jgi:hypothetical protein